MKLDTLRFIRTKWSKSYFKICFIAYSLLDGRFDDLVYKIIATKNKSKIKASIITFS